MEEKKSLGGRPPKPPEEKYSERIGLKVRPVDKKRLMKLADESGFSLSEYLVRRGLGKPCPTP